MRSFLSLESFDTSTIADSGPSQEYHDGYAAGFSAGQEATCAEADLLRRELVQSLTDMTFTYHEARQDVLSSLTGLVAALSETILPHCVAHGFAQQMADLVLTQFAQDTGETICIQVHPDQVSAVHTATETISSLVTVSSDPTLTLHAAWIGRANTETYVDMDRHLSDISDLLTNISHENQRIIQHG